MVTLSTIAADAGTITGVAKVVDGDGLIVGAVPVRIYGKIISCICGRGEVLVL